MESTFQSVKKIFYPPCRPCYFKKEVHILKALYLPSIKNGAKLYFMHFERQELAPLQEYWGAKAKVSGSNQCDNTNLTYCLTGIEHI